MNRFWLKCPVAMAKMAPLAPFLLDEFKGEPLPPTKNGKRAPLANRVGAQSEKNKKPVHVGLPFACASATAKDHIPRRLAQVPTFL